MRLSIKIADISEKRKIRSRKSYWRNDCIHLMVGKRFEKPYNKGYKI